jgi:hypothetical protein
MIHSVAPVVLMILHFHLIQMICSHQSILMILHFHLLILRYRWIQKNHWHSQITCSKT